MLFSLPEAALLLRQHIARFVTLSDEDWYLLLPHVRLVSIPKHGLFAREGRVAGEVAFVLEGMFRQFYTKDGEERTTYFFFENHLLSAYFSCLTGQPSLLTIEALSDAHYLSFPYAVLAELFEQRMAWQKFGRRLAEYLTVGLEERMVGKPAATQPRRALPRPAGQRQNQNPGAGAPALHRQLPGHDAREPEPHPRPHQAQRVG